MLLTRVLQRGVTLSPATAAFPTCATAAAAAWLSTSSSLLQQQNPQLMRLKQQPSDNSNNGDQQSSASLRTYLGAGGAAAAAAGWAAYAYSNSNSVSAPPISPTRLAHASPRAQAAVGAAACAAPLLHLQHALNPTPAQLQGITAALESEADTLGPELAVTLWGLAMFGAVLPQQQLARLAAAAIEQIPQLPVYEAILAAWAVTLLSSNSVSSSDSASSSSRRLGAAAWQQLLTRLQAAHHRELKDEASLLYLLHAALQQAAAAAAADANARPHPSTPSVPVHDGSSRRSSDADSSSSSSRSSSRSADRSSRSDSSSSGSVWRAAAMDQPHASLQEVLQTVQPLQDKIKRRLAAAYQEYVPFQPYVEGPLLVVLHIAKTLPRYIAAAAAAAMTSPGSSTAAAGSTAAAAAAGGGGPSPLVAMFGGLSAGDAQAASAVIADPAKLGKLKRDLYFRWRADELLDRHQQAVNQVAHVLYRRMQLPIQQGTDADVVLPSLKAAVFVVDDTRPGASEGGTSPLQVQPISGTASVRSSFSVSSSGVSGPFMPSLALSPPSPFTTPFWLEAHVGLQTLMRNRFSAPPGGFACRSCQGIAQAKVDALRKRGWTVVVLSQLEVEGALGGFKAGRVKVGESYDYCGLERMLRGRLEV